MIIMSQTETEIALELILIPYPRYPRNMPESSYEAFTTTTCHDYMSGIYFW